MSGETCLGSGCGSGVPSSSFLAAFEAAAAPPLLPLFRVLSGGRLPSLGTCSSTGGTLGPLLLPLRSSLTGPPAPPPVAGTGVVPRDLAGSGGALAGERAAAEVLRVDLRWPKAGGGGGDDAAAAAAESGVVVRRRERSGAIQTPTCGRPAVLVRVASRGAAAECGQLSVNHKHNKLASDGERGLDSLLTFGPALL